MPIAIDHIKHFDVIHILRRDVIPKWNPSKLKLKYGEVALGYEESGSGNGELVEIRAGNISGQGFWSGIKSFIPAFPVIGETPEEVIENRKNKVLGFNELGKAVLMSFIPGITGSNAIEISNGSGIEKVISLKLDEISLTPGLTSNSGLDITQNGLRINDTLTWILQCGGANS